MLRPGSCGAAQQGRTPFGWISRKACASRAGLPHLLHQPGHGGAAPQAHRRHIKRTGRRTSAPRSQQRSDRQRRAAAAHMTASSGVANSADQNAAHLPGLPHVEVGYQVALCDRKPAAKWRPGGMEKQVISKCTAAQQAAATCRTGWSAEQGWSCAWLLFSSGQQTARQIPANQCCTPARCLLQRRPRSNRLFSAPSLGVVYVSPPAGCPHALHAAAAGQAQQAGLGMIASGQQARPQHRSRSKQARKCTQCPAQLRAMICCCAPEHGHDRQHF